MIVGGRLRSGGGRDNDLPAQAPFRRRRNLLLTTAARCPIMTIMTSTARGYRYYAYPTLTGRRRRRAHE
jgi:hypothetical protein